MTTVYARRDYDQIYVSPEGHGGCGQTHFCAKGSDGAAIRPLAVSCPSCSPWLAKQAEWSTTEADIPETPDEVAGREAFQKRGAADRDNVLAIALAKIAGVELPQTIRQAISGVSPSVAIPGVLVCQNGHDAEPGSRFCPECGSPVRQPAVTARCPQGHENAASAKFCSDCGQPMTAPAIPAALQVPAPVVRQVPAAKVKPLKDWRADDLRALARDRGLDDSGTRVQVLERLKAAA